MKALSRIGIALAIVLGLMATARCRPLRRRSRARCSAGKCSLKKSEKCQDVLSSPTPKGAATEYWMVKNEAAEKAGHQCKRTQTPPSPEKSPRRTASSG